MPRPQGRTTDRTHLSIREVLDLLLEEFPDVTISKIRFLESRGLIHPERTPSGYRKFYEADVERLRWILRQQREHFLPLKVIKGRLEQDGTVLNGHEAPSLFDTDLDDESGTHHDATTDGHGPRGRLGHPSASPVLERIGGPTKPQAAREVEPVAPEPAETTPAPTVARKTPSRRSRANEETSFTRSELIALVGAPESLVIELEEFGLIHAQMLAGTECFDEPARRVVELAHRFASYGIEPRHLKSLKHAIEREAALYAQVVTPLVLQRNPSARERAELSLAELGELGASWREAFLTEELRGLHRG